MPASPRWSGSQRRIGLTGGIASGKSTVARWLQQQGLPVLDADVYAREALAAGGAAAKAVVARYGDAVKTANSNAKADEINRIALGQIVFSDAQERQWLEQLVHPLVRERFSAELEKLKMAPFVLLVVPLLFEAGLEGLCSEVWLVDCEPEQQLTRLMKRDGLNQADAMARIDAQWPLERKRALAERVIDNRDNSNRWQLQLQQALSDLAANTTEN